MRQVTHGQKWICSQQPQVRKSFILNVDDENRPALDLLNVLRITLLCARHCREYRDLN